MPVCYCTCPTQKIKDEPYAPCLADVRHTGAVLGTFERNGYDDSDFLAIVWTGEKLTAIEYASTRSWTCHNKAVVDASEDTIRAATEWYRAQWREATINNARADAAKPTKGRIVRSLTTRGKNVGVSGTVKWIGDDGYARVYSGPVPQRVGIKVDGEQKLRYLPLDRVEVVEPESVDENAITERSRTVEPHGWHSALYVHFR